MEDTQNICRENEISESGLWFGRDYAEPLGGGVQDVMLSPWKQQNEGIPIAWNIKTTSKSGVKVYGYYDSRGALHAGLMNTTIGKT